jgi:L-asparaginase
VKLPKISVLLMGGTISMTPSKSKMGGVVPTISAQDLCLSVPDIKNYAIIKAKTTKMVASANLDISDAIQIKEEIDNWIKQGEIDGVVIVQGTDTLEEMAFMLDLIMNVNIPVVMTGAMRSPNVASADGPGNLLNAVIAASNKELANSGVVVVMNGDIHAARYVQKCHTRDVQAFKSLNGGMLGQIYEGKYCKIFSPNKHKKFTINSQMSIPKVALVKVSFGDCGQILKLIGQSDFQGLVIEAFGAGHLPITWRDPLEQLLRKIPIMLCSRAHEGRVFENTYGYAGAEIDLIAKGLIPGGILDGLKARLYMQVCLMTATPITKPEF